MTTSLLRGLRALEMLGDEALGVSEIARRLGVDKAGVSRMLGQLHADGWVLRTGSRYVLAERAIGLAPGDGPDVRRRAGRLAEAIHDRTGLAAVVLRLAGEGAQPVAVRGPQEFLDDDEPFDHLWATAGGIALLAQLPDPELSSRLAAGHWPSHPPPAPQDPEAVLSLVRSVRAGAPAEERSWTIDGAGCLALPWPVLSPAPPHAALAVGPVALLDADTDALRHTLSECIEQF